MKDGRFRTLSQIQQLALVAYNKYYPDSSISACLRNFRKESFGAHTLNRRRKGNPKSGLFEYSLIVTI